MLSSFYVDFTKIVLNHNFLFLVGEVIGLCRCILVVFLRRILATSRRILATSPRILATSPRILATSTCILATSTCILATLSR